MPPDLDVYLLIFLTSLVPWIQVHNTPLSVSNLENDPKIRRTNSTTKGRQEAIMKKVGRVMTWSESETDHGVHGGEGASRL